MLLLSIKISKIFVGQEKDMHETVTLGCKLLPKRQQLYAIRPSRFKWCDFSRNFMLLFHMNSTKKDFLCYLPYHRNNKI